MAAKSGEENVATLYGDIHYFYSPPESRPRHHRFDKGSFVYLFEDPNARRCRVEIANCVGTDDQDAFEGFLDQTRVTYSYKHHCMVSLTVADTVAQSEWHLPTMDRRNENKYHYKLHSMDIYFWTQKDALQFVNGVRRVLPPSHVEVQDEPGPPATQPSMSAVVQNLEKAAISDPQYSSPNPQTGAAPSFAPPPTDSAASSHTPAPAPAAALAQPQPQGQPHAQAMPPPPPPPAAAPATFVPMAYNPAAPAAPEAIQHREKTPPPDEDPLNPLAVAVAYDYQKQPFTPGYPPSQFGPGGIMSPGFPPQGLASPGLPHSVASPGMPPQHPSVQRAATMPVYGGMPSPGLASPGLASPRFPGSPGMPPPPSMQQQHLQQQQHFPQQQPTPPVTSPGLPPQHMGSFGNYTHTPSPPQHPGSMQQDYSIHQQIYRPDGADPRMGMPGTGVQPNPYAPKQESRGRLEENAGRLERGVSGMFKKFEKKFG